LRRFAGQADDEAIVWQDRSFSYRFLLEQIDRWRSELGADIRNRVVVLEADFSPAAVAILFALIELQCVIVPIASSTAIQQRQEFLRVSEASYVIELLDERIELTATDQQPQHLLLQQQIERNRPGLILFSSGSTGESKATLHDFVPLLNKYERQRQPWRTLNFLLFDHIGGLNTLLHTLSNLGCVITVSDRSADTVCRAIEKHQVQILPTSPTFMNLLLLSESHTRHDLSSLRLVTYGTEPMPQSTLERFHQLMPDVRLQQTYGLSEVGILRSKSKSSDSLWMRIGGEGFETRIVDGMLEIRAESAMVGYLNAASPFTDDGWMRTGDAVEVDGEYLRVLGRKSELINVGGEKVYPAEVENILLQMEGVEDVTVQGQANPITGNIVRAAVRLSTSESSSDYVKRMRAFCRERLARFKVPQRVELVTDDLHSERFKKNRAGL